MSEQTNHPTQEFCAGNVKAAVWENKVLHQGETIVKHSVRIKKSYRGHDGQWQETDNYFPDDLPKLQLVAQKAYEFITLKQ